MRLLIFLQVGGILAACLAFGARPASAQNPPSRLVISDGAFDCAPYELCTAGQSCDSGSLACETLPTGVMACSSSFQGSRDLLCCNTATDCGSVGGSAAACVAVGDTGLRVCVYPDSTVFDSCVTTDAITLENAQACWTSPDNGEPASWKDGDCDGDLFPNATDPCPCDHNNTCGLADDVDIDMGTTSDMGGTSDLGPTGALRISFDGKGGCAASGSADLGAAASFGLLALALVARRRRRAS